ncbi:42290_t:CDS:2, partial [Gigaspora margarita]
MLTTIVAIIRCNKSLNKYKLLLQKEANLQDATQFLQPFYKTTNVISGSIYTTLAFIATILDPYIKLELIPANMNTEVNHAIFSNIFRSENFAPILNNSLTNSETPLNLSYTEKVAQKRRTNTFTDRTDKFIQYLNKAVLSI